MQEQNHNVLNDKIGIGVDLGSTSIAVCCLNMVTKDEICSFSFSNPQCQYGADVITRIRHCIDDNPMLDKLGNLVWEQLFSELNEHLGVGAKHISYIVISGNTTMQHIVRGLPVDGLAMAPFQPIDLEYREESILMNENEITIIYPPGFSAFVGADIMTGAQSLNLGQNESYDLLVDLGTNGELLLINSQHGFAASTACGPVFDHVLAGASYGSDSIHAIANCIKRGLIDSTGKIANPFFEKGIEIDKHFVIKQQNVRNFQLAKGAIYAGIQCLLKLAGITYDDISTVYVSGGLGFYMDIKDAFSVRMLPKEFSGKVVVTENTSLNGAANLIKGINQGNILTPKNIDSIKNEAVLAYYMAARQRTDSYELANLPDFQNLYMNALDF